MRQAETFLQAQGVQHELKRQVSPRHLGAAGHTVRRHRFVHVDLWVAVTHLAHDAVRETELAMSTGPDAKVIAKLPVVEVVPATVPGFGVGRNLITPKACGCGHAGDRVQHVIGGVLVGNHRRKLRKVGVGLDRQMVDRDMRALQCQRDSHVLS